MDYFCFSLYPSFSTKLDINYVVEQGDAYNLNDVIIPLSLYSYSDINNEDADCDRVSCHSGMCV